MFINPKTNPVDRTSLSVAFTVGLYGAAFGAAGVTAGFSILQTCLLSLLLFSGASQFAVVGIMGAGGSAISAIATATLLGFRNALYGIQMAPILKVIGIKKKTNFKYILIRSSNRFINRRFCYTINHILGLI